MKTNKFEANAFQIRRRTCERRGKRGKRNSWAEAEGVALINELLIHIYSLAFKHFGDLFISFLFFNGFLFGSRSLFFLSHPLRRDLKAGGGAGGNSVDDDLIKSIERVKKGYENGKFVKSSGCGIFHID